MDDRKLKHAVPEIYRRLFECYGPQRWWPALTPFEVIVGAILTQSAAWNNVEKAIENLRQADKLSPGALRRTTQPELARLIYSCGYYNVKARKLKAFTEWLGTHYDDNLDRLFSLENDILRRQLLEIYGIGEETADSIMLYAGNKPVFVIDAYTRRIIDRMGLSPRGSRYADYQARFMAHLPPEPALFNEYHALLVRLAKEVCWTKPICGQCCLNPQGAGEIDSSTGHFPCFNSIK